jgi:hypothetical protein
MEKLYLKSCMVLENFEEMQLKKIKINKNEIQQSLAKNSISNPMGPH